MLFEWGAVIVEGLIIISPFFNLIFCPKARFPGVI